MSDAEHHETQTELGDTGPGGDAGLWLKIEECDSVWIEQPGSCFVYPA